MDRPETSRSLASGSGSGPGAGAGAGTADGPPRVNLATGSANITIEASVVRVDGGRAALYSMFEAMSVTADGATLRGGLLLEVNEEVMLELRLPDLSAFRARARVVEIVRGDRPAMKVVWTGVAEADRHRLRR